MTICVVYMKELRVWLIIGGKALKHKSQSSFISMLRVGLNTRREEESDINPCQGYNGLVERGSDNTFVTI